jgi:hypothetical protein
MATLSDVLDALDLPRHSFNNWQRKGALRTEYAPTTQGVPVELTLENALELGFIFALTKLGTTPTGAGMEAEKWILDHKAGDLKPFLAFNMTDGREVGYGDPSLGFPHLARLMSEDDPRGWVTPRDRFGIPIGGYKPATVIAIVDRAEIARRVEKLFQE